MEQPAYTEPAVGQRWEGKFGVGEALIFHKNSDGTFVLRYDRTGDYHHVSDYTLKTNYTYTRG